MSPFVHEFPRYARPETSAATYGQRPDPAVGTGEGPFQVHRGRPIQSVPISERL